MPKWEHRLTRIDEAERRGDCAKCGTNVPIRRRSTDPARPGWRCRPPGEGRRTGAASLVRAKDRYRAKTHGIDPDAYAEEREAAKTCCDICGRSRETKRLAVDHCHTTGKVRGSLCSTCNRALGLFGDDIDVLTKAVAYLQRAARR